MRISVRVRKGEPEGPHSHEVSVERDKSFNMSLCD